MNIEFNQLCIRNAEKKDCAQLAKWWNDGKVMAHAGFPNGKIIICSDKFNELLYFVFSNFIKFFWKCTSDAGLFCRVNVFIFELFLYPKYQNSHLGIK